VSATKQIISENVIPFLSLLPINLLFLLLQCIKNTKNRPWWWWSWWASNESHGTGRYGLQI